MSYYETSGWDVDSAGYQDELSGWDEAGAVAPVYQQRRPFNAPRAPLRRYQPGMQTGRCQVAPAQCGPKGRLLILGFDSVTTIAAGASAIITQRPQVLFQPSRVVVPSSIAPSFLINDLKIGKNSQFTASGSLPAAVFSELSVGVALAMDAATVAQDISLNVTNTSAGALRFTAAMIGESCETF